MVDEATAVPGPVPRAMIARLSGPAFFTVVSALGPLIGLITGTLTARWLTPAQFGTIQTALLLSPYLTFLGFGVYHGLNREYPYLIGCSRPERALDMAGASWLATKYITLATLLVALIYALVLSTKSQEPGMALAAWSAVPIVCVYPLATHLEVLFRTRDDFTKFGWIQLLGYVASIASLVLVAAFGFIGQCIRLIVNAGINLSLRWVWRPLKQTRAGNWSDVRTLSTIGLPLLAVTYLYGVFVVADRSVVALKLGPEAVGYYSLMGIVLASMTAFPMAIAQVLLPRASSAYGSHGQARQLRHYVWLSSLLTMAFLIPVAIIGWWLLPILVALILPKYLPGVEAARIGLIAGAISLPALTTIFTTLRKNSFYIGVLMVCTGLIWVVSLLALKAGGDLTSVALVRLAATALLSGSALSYAVYLTR